MCAVWSWAVLSYLRPTGTNSCSTFWVSVCCDINAAVLLSTPLKGFLLAYHDCQRCYSKESFTWKCLHQTPHTRLISLSSLHYKTTYAVFNTLVVLSALSFTRSFHTNTHTHTQYCTSSASESPCFWAKSGVFIALNVNMNSDSLVLVFNLDQYMNVTFSFSKFTSSGWRLVYGNL